MAKKMRMYRRVHLRARQAKLIEEGRIVVRKRPRRRKAEREPRDKW